ncbi:MAG TPA: hypothetical protein VIH69_06190 [Dehalococcoidia bacterium]
MLTEIDSWIADLDDQTLAILVYAIEDFSDNVEEDSEWTGRFIGATHNLSAMLNAEYTRRELNYHQFEEG